MAPLASLTRTRIWRLPNHLRIAHLQALPRVSYQVRNFYGDSHRKYNHDRPARNIRLIFRQHPRSRRHPHPHQAQTVYHKFRPYQSPGWGWGSSFNAGFPQFQRWHKLENDFWEDRKTRAQRRMEWFKKEVEADPYAALFGRRLEPLVFGVGSKLENTFSSLYRSLFGLDESSPETVNTNAKVKSDILKGTSKESREPETGETQSQPSSSSLFRFDDSSPETVNAKAKVKSDVRQGAPKEGSPESETSETRSQPSSSRDAGYEFDPISGRMVLVAAESSKTSAEGSGHYTPETQAVESKSQPDQRGFLSPVVEPGTKQETESVSAHEESAIPNIQSETKTRPDQHGFLSPVVEPVAKQDTDNVVNYGESAIPEIQREPEHASTSTSAQHNEASDLEADQKVPQGVFERPEALIEALHTESSQTQSGTTLPALAGKERTAISQDGMVLTGESLDIGHVATSDSPLVDDHTLEGRDRLGFLSRRDKPSCVPTDSTISQERVIGEQDRNIEELRASDIRAAYEARRSKIQSEVELERREGLDRTIAHRADFTVDNKLHPQPLPGQNEAASTSADSSTIIASSHASESDVGGSTSPPEVAPSTGGALSGATNAVPSQSSAAEYRVFAYDPSSNQVTEADPISSIQASSDHSHPIDVLTRLASPAKFLPCLRQMHAEGYEIVSGGGNIIVFQNSPKTGREIPRDARTQKADDDQESSTNRGPVQEAAAATVQQPIEHDSYTGDPSSLLSAKQSQEDRPKSKARKETRPKSKTKKEKRPESKSRKILRRMLISGAATAGTYYALGVLADFFRTGGEGGWGIDGFTEFESERRHRE
ncbi:hypothetical protein BJX61DRAFT_82785 [Aspergillus egyptiacus]|nr:hypothetical protein BJX61DRAFT_82785 [Aspergillus egyptiacus]